MQSPNLEKVQGWAARRLTEQQIADVMGFDLEELKKDRQLLVKFRESIRKGISRGEAELKAALYKRAKEGSAFAYESLKRRDQDSD